MKKLLALSVAFCLCLGLSSCKANDHQTKYTDDYESEYNAGYEDGYEAGLWDGVFECKKDFANAVRDRYFDVEHATGNGRDFHPEEAIMILNDYLDGEYVSDAELAAAIESLTDFYCDWQSVIANIDDMDVDIDFD